MTSTELFNLLKQDFKEILAVNDLARETIDVSAKSLTPEEAIGNTKRKDYPILTGSEVMVQARYGDSFGQAFTDTPTEFHGTLEEIADLDIHSNGHDRSIFIATLNALKQELKLCDNVVHCRNEGPELCSKQILLELNARYGDQKPNILLVGYQPAMIAQLSTAYTLRVLDLNPKNVGTEKCGIIIEHGINDMQEAIAWSDLILCTGSTLCNGSIVDYLSLDKEVLYFGTTISGSADILKAKRLCFTDFVTQLRTC